MKWLALATLSAAFLIYVLFQPQEAKVTVPISQSSQVALEPLLKVDIDGEDQTNRQFLKTDSWLNADIRPLFDYFAAMFVEGEQAMWAQFNQYCAPLNYCSSLTELYKRYLAYKVSLGDVDDSPLYTPQEFTARLDDVKSLRSTIFSLAEIQALFADEEIWNRHAIDRMQINQDPILNDEDKMILLEQHIASLPGAMKASILPTLNLRKISQLRNQNHVKGEANYNSYAAEFGSAVAQRLINVENAQQQWQSNIRLFLREKEKLDLRYANNPADHQLALHELETQMFTPNESRRLKVYLSNPSLLADTSSK